ncbi:MAG: DNA helicase RecQ [Chlamydiota bacterium]
MPDSLQEHLKALFGYNSFRDSQEQIIKTLLAGRDVLAILPTGAGKSLCYQLPAMLLPGITLVVSPLISLMQDQVVSLSKNGLSAAFLNSSLPLEEVRNIMQNLSQHKILYIAPERFADKEFLAELQKTPVSLFAIDEAHCISQWGHAFRLDYRQLSLLKKLFPKVPIIALTATATAEVEKDILLQLAMKDPFVAKTSFDRPNLTLRVYPKKDALTQVCDFLDKYEGKPGIIYSATRDSVDDMYDQLKKKGLSVGKYHAGLSSAKRAEAQHDFVYGELSLIVATVAFGMGIHKPDIRFIIHLDMPQSIEQYYQEIGRAGRDGLASECLMLYSPKELLVYDFFLGKITDPVLRKKTKEKTEKIKALCHSSLCRRVGLLSYFGETFPVTFCNGCDNCLDDTELFSETINAQKILSCVYKLRGNFSISHVINVLLGIPSQEILENGQEQLSTFGLMKDLSRSTLHDFIYSLIQLGFLIETKEEKPLLQWSPTSGDVIKGIKEVLIRKKIRKAKYGVALVKAKYDKKLFALLTELRQKLAKRFREPTHVIFGDQTLIEMSQTYPTTRDAMMMLNGFSPLKWEKYGILFCKVIVDYVKKTKS